MATHVTSPLLHWLLLGALLAGCDSDPSEGRADAGEIPAVLLEPLADGGTDTWSSYAGPFFSTYCPSCHGGTTPAARDYRTFEDVRTDSALIRCGVASVELPGCEGETSPRPREFPRGSGPIPDDGQRARIVTWIDDGMPE